MHVAEAAVPGGDIVVTKLFDAADHSGHLRCKNFAVSRVNAGRRAAFLAASRRGPRPGGSREKGSGTRPPRCRCRREDRKRKRRNRPRPRNVYSVPEETEERRAGKEGVRT